MKPHNFTPSRKFNLSLIVLITLNLLPHLEDHLTTTLIIGLISIVWRILHEYQKVKLPNIILKLLLIIGSCYLVFFQHGQITGAEPATALLIAGVSLKLIDSVDYHDAMVVLFLNFLLLMSRFLVSQSLSLTILGILNLALVTALLLQLHKGKEIQLKFLPLLKLGFKLFLQTAPLLTLLFFVFPRFSTGFIQLNNETQAKSGFSPQLAPGEVSKLIASDEIAFRVVFGKNVPQPKDRYWRGAVLSFNQGLSWEPAKEQTQTNYSRQFRGELFYEQNIILEPNYGTWLFALETPISLKFKDQMKQMQSYIGNGRVYTVKQNNGQKLSYKVYSDPMPKQMLLEKEKYLQIKNEDDERLKQLIKITLQQSNNELDIKNNYLDFFSKNLKYSLNPTPVKNNSVSEFLFDTKIGFCEHLASSFAYLLRASGVPARIVVGFQGGEKNDFGEHYTVKDKDAHAWVEMWSNTLDRWLRVDPTEVVAPLRLELGGQMYHSLSQDELNAGLSQDEYLARFKSSWYFKVIVQSQLAFDLASMRWNQFLLDFDKEGQRQFFRKLGLENLKLKKLGFLSLFALIIFFIWLNRKRYFYRKGLTQQKSIYNDLCLYLDAHLVKKKIYFGPKDYFQLF
ncbi:MAG: DUF3488 domain-containing transglutaminase family protein [Bdellovibrionales bacterium]|nr:DUF3488 domain-containing transglutaminase family protein [Bdellovibrionales bacterium]